VAFVVRGKSGKVVGRYATRGEAEARIEQLRAGASRLAPFRFSGGLRSPSSKKARRVARRADRMPKVLPAVYHHVGVPFGGELPNYADGGYPIVYYDKNGESFCGKCASNYQGFDPIKYADVYYEGPPQQCAECGEEIESAYGDPNADEDSEGSPRRRRSSRSPRVPEGWVEEIAGMLNKAGYAGDLRKHAERLVREGYGPEEIAHRIRTGQISNSLGIQMVKRGFFKMSPRRRSSRSSRSALSSILKDARYDERHGFRGWNIQPTVLQEPRLFPRVFPELTRADHARLAALYDTRAKIVQGQHHKWVARGEKIHGRNGPTISGGFHTDWPESVKETIRRLAHGYSKLRDAAVAHRKASRMRGIR
jgi:hypothetical protein